MGDPALDPVIHQANRLRVMTLLFKNRELAFTTLRNLLGMTDGNLASHLSKLEAARYVKTGRVLVGVGFEVHAKITEDGSRAFRAYLGSLRRWLEEAEPAAVGNGPMGLPGLGEPRPM